VADYPPLSSARLACGETYSDVILRLATEAAD
jgi:hypothetical protein